MSNYEFYVNGDTSKKPFVIRAESLDAAKETLSRHLGGGEKSAPIDAFKEKSEIVFSKRAEGELIAEQKPEYEKSIPEMIVSGIFPATSHVAETDGGLPKQLAAGVADAASWMIGMPTKAATIGRGVLGMMSKPAAMDVLGNTIAGTAQGVLSGEGVLPSAAMAGGVAGAARGSLGAAGLLKEMGPEGYAKFAEQLSGADAEAIKAWAKGGVGMQSIIDQAGQQRSLTTQILDDINNPSLTLADSKGVVQALEGKTVDLSPTIDVIYQTLEDVAPGFKGKGLTPQQKKLYDKVQVVVDYLSNGPTIVDANEARKMRAEVLDQLIDFESQDLDPSTASQFNRVLKKARTQLKNDLIDAGGEGYQLSMRKWANKLDARERLIKMLGKTEFTREQRATTIFDNLFGRNKEARQELLKDFDDAFGTDYVNKLQSAWHAKSLGVTKENKVPQWPPTQLSGRSLLGLAMMGGLTPNIPAPLLPFAPLAATAWSPRVASGTLENIYKVGDSNALERILGGAQMFSSAGQNVARRQLNEGK